MSSNPVGRVSRGFCAKNAATSMEAGARWSVVASAEKKKSGFFAIIFGFFRIFILPSVNLCRVLFRYSAKALPALGKGFAECPTKKHSANSYLPTKRCRVLYAECYIRQSSCRVFLGHCRVPLALGETTISRSEYCSTSSPVTQRRDHILSM